jgi:radical SAM superfamily enzyme YgiQ (UPF0313 family)
MSEALIAVRAVEPREPIIRKVAQKKVMLIEPPFYRLYHDNFSLVKYPLALGYLSGAVKKWTDWDVQTYNADFCTTRNIEVDGSYLIGEGFQRYLQTLSDRQASIWEEVRTAIDEFGPGVVGISAKTQNFASAAIVARIAKAVNPEIQVVLGGPHATMSPQHALDTTPEIDVVAAGEGEMTLVELLDVFASGKSLADIDGLWLRGAKGNFTTGSRDYVPDLDDLPPPVTYVREVLRDFDKYPIEAFRHIFSARGCPYACTFCESKAIWTRKTRWRSPQHVIDEIKELQKMGVRHIMFDDDTFGIKHEYIEDICNKLKEQCPGLTWGCEMTVGISKEKSIVAMKEAGCTTVYLGVESGNDEMLKKIKKSQTVEGAIEAVDLYRKHGIQIFTFFMIGFPEETEETLADTVRAIKRIGADSVILSVFTPYPGSQLFEHCKKLGVVDDNFDVTRHNHQSPENCFTAYIPRERFKVLVAQTTRMVDRKNTLAKFRRLGVMVRSRGILYVLRYARNWVTGVIATRMLPVFSNAFYKRETEGS